MSSQHLSSNNTSAADSNNPGALENEGVTAVVSQEGNEKLLPKDRKRAIEDFKKAIARQREILASMETSLAVLEALYENQGTSLTVEFVSRRSCYSAFFFAIYMPS
ncbi:hypothetical protein GYMLUDRAFT_242509 [Collybiopsis luxurians FD-317 M1]|uniref:Uncharacterized protein n=1 Tax=Collybiopsis luxurians FD-317 M1 TaxID=944289 RepID=A0A0D0D1A2_9AGAR|nr:hypothetical protein GYMLUDRAFT_242509 [Collybiopsis luxurians FD-317 M1]